MEKVFDAPVSSTEQALECLAAMCFHIPDRGEQMVRYYVPCILEADKSSKESRKNWVRLIQKIGACPKCRGIMQIISFIEDREVIKTILKHLPHYPWDAYLQS